MGRLQDEYAVLIEDADLVELELAKGLLIEAGIPWIAHGPDFDVAELGYSAHANVRGRAILVPNDALEPARAVLRKAWGRDV